MLKCRDLVHDADALLDGGLPLTRRLMLWMHLFVCVYCRRYLRQLRLMIGALRRCDHDHASEQEVARVVEVMERSREG